MEIILGFISKAACRFMGLSQYLELDFSSYSVGFRVQGQGSWDLVATFNWVCNPTEFKLWRLYLCVEAQQ